MLVWNTSCGESSDVCSFPGGELLWLLCFFRSSEQAAWCFGYFSAHTSRSTFHSYQFPSVPDSGQAPLSLVSSWVGQWGAWQTIGRSLTPIHVSLRIPSSLKAMVPLGDCFLQLQLSLDSRSLSLHFPLARLVRACHCWQFQGNLHPLFSLNPACNSAIFPSLNFLQIPHLSAPCLSFQDQTDPFRTSSVKMHSPKAAKESQRGCSTAPLIGVAVHLQ